MRLFALLLVLAIILTGILGPQAFFVVDETQTAIVTRFGNPKQAISTPGLKVKTPFVDTVTYFDKRRKLFDAPPASLLTLDKKRLVIDVYAITRVVDPLTFFRRVRTEQGSVTASIPIISSELRNEIAQDDQSEIISTNREEIMGKVTDSTTPLLSEFGIAVVDVRVKRVDFPPEIAPNIYARMNAERKRIADRERAEGDERALEVTATADKDATIIRSEAEKEAARIRGDGEAEAIRVFAEALERDPEFYVFHRSLQAYKNFLTQNTTVVLPADSELFQFLQRPGGNSIAPSASTAGTAPAPTSGTLEVAARQVVSDRLDIDGTSPALVRIEVVDWPDASLGCPEAGMSYAPDAVTGFNVVFEHNGDQIEVHANADGSRLVTCGS